MLESASNVLDSFSIIVDERVFDTLVRAASAIAPAYIPIVALMSCRVARRSGFIVWMDSMLTGSNPSRMMFS